MIVLAKLMLENKSCHNCHYYSYYYNSRQLDDSNNHEVCLKPLKDHRSELKKNKICVDWSLRSLNEQE